MVSKEPIEKILYPTVAREYESERLRVRCPVCGEDSFYRFIHAENQNWMCFNPDCDAFLEATDIEDKLVKRTPACGKADCVHYPDIDFPCYECIDDPDCQKPWHPSFYERPPGSGGCPKCDNPPQLKHTHGECLPPEWASWDFTPPEGWEVDEELTYLTDGGILIIRIKKVEP